VVELFPLSDVPVTPLQTYIMGLISPLSTMRLASIFIGSVTLAIIDGMNSTIDTMENGLLTTTSFSPKKDWNGNHMTDSPEQTLKPSLPPTDGGSLPKQEDQTTESGLLPAEIQQPWPEAPLVEAKPSEIVYTEEPGGILIDRDNTVHSLGTIQEEKNKDTVKQRDDDLTKS
jgi:hypothetical protein